MRTALLTAVLLSATSASAQIYRWVDEKGTVHYSNSSPPQGAKATVFDREAKAGPPSPESAECYTVRCQGERLEQRLARQQELDARLAAERAAATPPRPRGLDFRRYISLSRGMSEGELLTVAGSPDVLFSDDYGIRHYTYLPTTVDPFTTTILVIGGRISQIERVRKF
ncbi:MAG TPA: DUF4124 domain-containing protein [Burkholderiales bacterium]|jgi:hypothetical protein|nr:DUF4124 domain-containing protein [Burkholderiales bacterium]